IVAFNNKVFGKPRDINEAIEMLSTLQGNTHSVYRPSPERITPSSEFGSDEQYIASSAYSEYSRRSLFIKLLLPVPGPPLIT
ncbi:MAG: Maf family protein, partial [Clostridia bacterium]|nr:Maf family protein [Clostridia bacterium]